jgi:ABC-2 type transport system ATP-binding protein
MAGLADDGTTVFLSTHILPVVEAVADTVGVLYDGRLVAEGTPDGLKRRAETGSGSLEDAFLAVTSEGAAVAETGAGADG